MLKMWKVSNWLLILALTMALLLAKSYASPSALSLQEVEALSPDEETVGDLIPRLAAKYASESSWRGVLDPRLFVLTEMESSLHDAEDGHLSKRQLPSLSIVNPMEVLRQRLLLEIARKQMRENNQRQIDENRIFLQNVGKRSIYSDRFRRYDGEGDGFQRAAKLTRYFSNSNLLDQTLNDDSANETA